MTSPDAPGTHRFDVWAHRESNADPLALLLEQAALVDLAKLTERPEPRTVHLPVWEDEEIPPWWHSCSRMARTGRAKIVPLPLPAAKVIADQWAHQVCPCGNDRVMLWIDGQWQPYGSWCGDRNAARRDPAFRTRRSAYPDGAPSGTLFV